MSPSREGHGPPSLSALLAAAGLAAVLATAPAAGAQQPSPPSASASDAAGPVEDIVGEVESLDGTESEVREGRTVTVALTSDVLFAFDQAELTADARLRLADVAEQVRAESAGGPIRIEGHTDDQGSDAYNDDLSRRRAEAVRDALAELLGGQGTDLEASGLGERAPRVPNIVDGEPNEANRARNRRVEIIYDVLR